MIDYMQDTLQEIEAGLNLVSQDEYSGILRAVAKTAAGIVVKTLGPYAHTTIIDDGSFAYPTKDGWTVLSRIKFADPVHQSMFRMLQQIPFRIVDKVGDGTSTAMDAAQHFIELMSSGHKKVNFQGENLALRDLRQADVVDSLQKVKREVIEELQKMATPINNDPEFEAIYRIAYISSNGNQRLASIMHDIYYETKNPNVLVDLAGPEDGIDYEIQEGYRLDCSLLMANRYVNTSEKNYDTQNGLHQFVIFDHNVMYNTHMKLINDLLLTVNSMSANRQEAVTLVLFAPHFDDLMASTIAATVDEMLKKNPGAIPNIMMVQIPELSRHQVQCYVHDFAAIANVAITNSTKVKVYNQMKFNEKIKDGEDKIDSPEMHLEDYAFATLHDFLLSCMGAVRQATFGRKHVTLNYINQDSVRYREAVDQANEELKRASEMVKNSSTTLMKDYMEASDRVNRLTGRIGIIHVGGSSDLERSCSMDVVDDVFRACRSAYENGVVPGMNLATLVALQRVFDSYTVRMDAEGEFPSNRMAEIVLSTLIQAYKETTYDLLRNKKDDDELWELKIPGCGADLEQGQKLKAPMLVGELMHYVSMGVVGSYDIMTEQVYPLEEMRVINSVSTDIEILNGIVGILSLTLTSDQYLSVSRFYDKRIATKQQELANAKDIEARVTAAMRAFQSYLAGPSGKLLAVKLRELIKSEKTEVRYGEIPVKSGVTTDPAIKQVATSCEAACMDD